MAYFIWFKINENDIKVWHVRTVNILTSLVEY